MNARCIHTGSNWHTPGNELDGPRQEPLYVDVCNMRSDLTITHVHFYYLQIFINAYLDVSDKGQPMSTLCRDRTNGN